ncbi:response regulator transcription factor [Rhodocytophaga rosea]|uniref:Response regulator transcription factor n=1 Tax=Rhodocytophaga rosea TaxID=2704465 RepID=A0A6C0GDU7_9BACT|nr:response regulator transcription factor [Rhodocytophaga rosea]QHT66136.1 response regulator transcription factor [Rhodocytophaga rosea]
MIHKTHSEKLRILLVEDDPSMGYLLQDNLEMAGYEVDLYADGQLALNAYLTTQYHMGVFDVMLPQKDGFSLAIEIRRLDQKLPIIFLTARSMKEDRIRGFKIGADDYITKPFSIEEFILRLEAIFKRVYDKPSQADKQALLQFGNCLLDSTNQTLQVRDQLIQLTQKEARLLQIFAVRPNQLIARDIIQKAIWEDDGYFVGRSMDVFISRLRKMLKADVHLKIVNVHGTGYKLEVSN